MTPEELEARMSALITPEPSGALRERLVRRAGRSAGMRAARRAFPALAAAALAFGLILWVAVRNPWAPGAEAPAVSQDEIASLIERLGHESLAEREKAAERLIQLGAAAETAVRDAVHHEDPQIAAQAAQIAAVFERERRFGAHTKDRALQERLERLLKANPGKALLVVRAMERRQGGLVPVKAKDYSIGITLNGSDVKMGTRNVVSAEAMYATPEDGYLVYIVPPGKGRIMGPDLFRSRIGANHLSWSGLPLTYEVTEILMLPDLVLVPKMRWTSPASGAAVSIKAGCDLSWEEVPGAARVSIQLLKIDKQTPGSEAYLDAARVDADCSKGRKVPLADLLKASTLDVGPGTLVGLRATAYASDGTVLAEHRDLWRFELVE